MIEVTRYTVLREDGYYPDGTYRSTHVWKNVVSSTLDRAKLWQYRKYPEQYVGKFGGKVIEVKVTYERMN